MSEELPEADAYDGTEDDLMTAEELARDRAAAGLPPDEISPEQAATVTPGRAAYEAYMSHRDQAPPFVAGIWAGMREHSRERWEAAAAAGAASAHEHVAELVTEVNELRKLVAEILYVIEGGFDGTRNIGNIGESSVAIWRKRAGLPPAVVTAGTEHLAEKIRGLAIPDEES